MITTSDERTDRLTRLRGVAYRIRRHALNLAEVQGQGYIGQALGVADILAVLYADQPRFRPQNPDWPERDRILNRAGPREQSASQELEKEAIRRAADPDRLMITLENHMVVGGLGEAVAATVAYAGLSRRVVSVGLPDEFLAAGALPTLHDQYGLSTEAVIAGVKAELGSTRWPRNPTARLAGPSAHHLKESSDHARCFNRRRRSRGGRPSH
jgi:hypothetical protein